MRALKRKYEEQGRLLANVCSHGKNPAAGLNHLNNELNTADNLSVNERSKEEAARSERLAR